MNVSREEERERRRGGDGVKGDGERVGPFSWLIGWVYLHVLAA